MKDGQFENWNRVMRERAVEYLERHRIKEPRVGDWPAFEVAPNFGMWCVESKEHEGKIGWWVFAGDCPTEYLPDDGHGEPRVALAQLVSAWSSCIPYLKSGRQPPGRNFGDTSNLTEMGRLLEKRVAVLKAWIADDEIWTT